MEDKIAIRGIPSVTYARVLSSVGDAVSGSSSSDIVTEGNSIMLVEPGQPSMRYDVAQVLDSGLSDHDICECTIGNQAGAGLGAVLNPVTACVLDAVTCVIFVVGAKSTKKWQFLKRSFLPFLADELFGTIMDKENETSDQYNAEIKLSSFEIQDEVITDLLRPTSRGLAVTVTTETGIVVNGLHRQSVRNEQSMLQLFSESCENRACHTLPPGASIDSSSAVWEISLKQTEFNAATEMSSVCTSKLLIVDVPAVDPLSMEGRTDTTVSLLAGPTLHKSLVTLVDVTKKLSSPAKAALAPFRSSKLTHFLSELLGGNAIVIGLGLLSPGEPGISRSTLQLMGFLTRAVHFPVGGKEHTEVLQGLLAKYRSLILQLQDEIANGAPIGESPPPSVVTEKLVQQLQGELATALLDRNVALADATRLYEMMELLKSKCQTVLEQKMAQSKEVIKSEEEKLQISRTLIELKMEHSSLKEQYEAEKFELTSSALSTRNDLFDLDAQVLLAKSEADSLKEQNAGHVETIRELELQLTAAQSSQIELRNSCKTETDRNIELSSELLTLVNQKEVISNQKEVLAAKCIQLQEAVDARTMTIESLNVKIDGNDALVNDLKAINQKSEERLREALCAQTESELELKQRLVENDHTKLDYERSAADFLRSKDLAYDKVKRNAERELASVEKTKEELVGKIRSMERKTRELERNLQRSHEDLAESRESHESLDKEMHVLRKAYRDHLSSTMGSTPDSARSSTVVSREGNSRKDRVANGARKISQLGSDVDNDASVAHLISSYSDVEVKSRSEVKRCRLLLALVKDAYRELFDKYRLVVDILDEKLPSFTTMSENTSLEGPEDEIRDREMLFICPDGWQEEGVVSSKQLETDVILEKEKSLAMVNAYKRQIAKAEEKLALNKKEIATLHVQIKQLSDNTEGWKKNKAAQYESKLKKLSDDYQEAEEHTQAFSISSRDPLDVPDLSGMLELLKVAETKVVSLSVKNLALEEELKTYKAYMKETVMLYKKQMAILKPKDKEMKELEGRRPVSGGSTGGHKGAMSPGLPTAPTSGSKSVRRSSRDAVALSSSPDPHSAQDLDANLKVDGVKLPEIY